MVIRLKKTRDGVVLSCLREGWPAAVQRTRHGGFFAWHDLMHYAVETTLGFHEAFFGLMAAGWSFETFGDKDDPRYLKMPAQALWAEMLVGILSRQYQDCSMDEELLPLWTEEVNTELAASLGNAGMPPLKVETAQLLEICRRLRELAEEWAAVPVGGHMEVSFAARSP